MLTAFQCSTAAYVTEDGELLCSNCFDEGDAYAKPIIQYALDEWQAVEARDFDWAADAYWEAQEDLPDGVDVTTVNLNEFHAECEPALFDANGHELREAYHYHREQS